MPLAFAPGEMEVLQKHFPPLRRAIQPDADTGEYPLAPELALMALEERPAEAPLFFQVLEERERADGLPTKIHNITGELKRNQLPPVDFAAETHRARKIFDRSSTILALLDEAEQRGLTGGSSEEPVQRLRQVALTNLTVEIPLVM